jgi:hypothetical protein
LKTTKAPSNEMRAIGIVRRPLLRFGIGWFGPKVQLGD